MRINSNPWGGRRGSPMEQLNEEGSDKILISTSELLSNKERIVDLLKENNFGLTIADFSKELGTTRHTVSIVLAELRGAHLIEIRKVGIAKIHVLKGGLRDVV